MKVRIPEGAKRGQTEKDGRKRGTARCPQCGSHRLSGDMAWIGGAKVTCVDCGFRGGVVVMDDEEAAAIAQKRRSGGP